MVPGPEEIEDIPHLGQVRKARLPAFLEYILQT